MIEIPIFRPEITVFESTQDYEWASRNGTNVWSSFASMPDEDRRRIGQCLRTVAKGEAPAFVALVPEGWELIARGSALFLRSSEGKLLHAIEALIKAKRGEDGFGLKAEADWRSAPVQAGPVAPSRPKAPVKQLSLFGEEAAHA